MSKGYIKLHRKILDNGIFENAELLKVFVWCILKANSEPAVVYGRSLKAGQFVTGRVTAAEELRLPPSTVYDRMQRLQKMKYIKIDSNTKNSKVTVLKYKTYQGYDTAIKRDLQAVASKFKSDVWQAWENRYDDYSETMVSDFVSYWCEPNRSKTKLRYELQPTFCIERRLKTWYNNQANFKKQTKSNILDTWQEARKIINDE